MQIIKIEQLIVGENRQRRAFDETALADLAKSISSPRGLLHPPVVRKDGDNFRLVAGERRVRAIQSLQLLETEFFCGQEKILPGFIPVTLLNELSELDAEEAELEENVLRVDLTVQEQALAVARLHSLRENQNGTQTLGATATEIYATPAKASKVNGQLLIAKHLDKPEVAKAKTYSEAVKAIEKIEKAKHRELLAEQFDLQSTQHQLHFGDTFAIAKTLPDNEFDLILTDPPYGIEAQNFGSQSSGHNYQDSFEYAMSCYHLVATEGFRVTRKHASVYAFCHISFFAQIAEIFRAAGWIVWERPLIWAKGNGMLPRPDYGPRNTYEAIVFAYKPETKIIKPGQNDVLAHRVGTGLEHGAQKPVSLFLEILLRSANPSAKVVDFFAGSGTIFPACNMARMYAVGIEGVKANYDLALSRINEEELDLSYGL